VPYDQLIVEHMVVVDLTARCGRESQALVRYGHPYGPDRNFGTIGGITHTHSAYAVAWAKRLGRFLFWAPPMPTTATWRSRAPVLIEEQVQGNIRKETGELIVRTFATIPFAEQP
jgi:L-ribulose-5-phosphate 4-epimerase